MNLSPPLGCGWVTKTKRYERPFSALADRVYLDPKDSERSVYRTAMVSTQVYKTS